MRNAPGCALAVALAVASVACGGGSAGCPEPAATARVEVPDAPMRGIAPRPSAPDGFVEMTAAGIMPGLDGSTLVLTDAERTVLVPVVIGAAEAMVIDLRLRGERFERPLTHDLLSSAIETLGGEVVMVQVNKLRGNVFVGSIFVWDGETVHHIDSRTSDAVAVALGHGAPIYVAQSVIDDTGVPADQLQ